MKKQDDVRLQIINVSLEELRKEDRKYILVSGIENEVKLETVNEIPNKFNGISLKSQDVTVSILNDAIKEVRRE